MQIESFFPGRIRVRSTLFTQGDHFTALTRRLRDIDGIRDVTNNPKTGSVTILYDASKITMDMLMEARAEIEKWEGEG